MSDGELLKKAFPQYLAMGMTSDEYWNGDAELPRYFREAHLLRRKQANFDAWLNGYYVYNALLCASPLFRDWVKDHRPEEYFGEPLDLYPDKKTISEEQRLEDARELANQAKVKAWVSRVNRLKSEKKEA